MKTTIALLLMVCGLSACQTVGPVYQAPAPIPSSLTWQAALPHQEGAVSLADWWRQFHDPVLSKLLEHAEKTSPNLELAMARISEVRAGLVAAKANELPSVNGGASSGLSGDFDNGGHRARAGFSVDSQWEVDLFGAVKHTNEAANARVDARVADWQHARVSLAAEVANVYVNWHTCQTMLGVYERTLLSRQEIYRLTKLRVDAGFAAAMDAKLLAASVADNQAQRENQRSECGLLVKSLVTLTGLSEPHLRDLLQQAPAGIPQAPVFAVSSLPVQLLSQRPDLAATERDLAASSAEIGSAEANRYPRLALMGSIGVDVNVVSGTLGHSLPWSFGPSLSVPLFDADKRSAAVTAATARYEQALARYQQSVRLAVQEVESALVRLQGVQAKQRSIEESASSYQSFFESTEAAWKAGSASLLNVEDARRNRVGSELAALQWQRDTTIQWIALYKALGGGWQLSAKTENTLPTNTLQPFTASTTKG